MQGQKNIKLCKIIVLFSFILIFLDKKWQTKYFVPNDGTKQSLPLKKSCSQWTICISFSIEKIIIPCSYRAPLVPPNLLHTH